MADICVVQYQKSEEENAISEEKNAISEIIKNGITFCQKKKS